MENQKQQLVERLKSANNILVTVSSNPTVDQLSAAIGLTLMLNKMGKHGTAVFSGKVPSTIEFLQPESTLEKNTDSLRDFIIALDKSKADKLRYKVEDSHVRIFITPYRTSISEKDLDFSQGDFNVEVVVALGVADQKDLDKAIIAHGRILHDATTISVTNGTKSQLGSIDWDQADASSLCEMITDLAKDLGEDVLDGQIATALMTGVVAETERFRNDKTTPATMSASAVLMHAGANQQLVASKLEAAHPPLTEQAPAEPEIVDQLPVVDDGSLQIDHSTPVPVEESPPTTEQAIPEVEAPEFSEAPQEQMSESLPAPELPPLPEEELQLPEPPPHQSLTLAPPRERLPDPEEDEPESKIAGGGSLIVDPPTLGGTLTANTKAEGLDPSLDPLSSNRFNQPLLARQEQPAQNDEEALEPASPEPSQESSPPAEPSNGQVDEPVELPAPSMDLPSEAPSLEPGSNQPEPPVVQPQAPDYQSLPSEPPAQDAEPPVDSQDKTLTELEAVAEDSVDASQEESPSPDPAITPSEPQESSEDMPNPTPDLSGARDAVAEALIDSSQPLPPISALNAQPFDMDVQADAGLPANPFDQPKSSDFTIPENLMPSPMPMVDPTAGSVQDPTAAPAVPPPFMPGAADFNGIPDPSPLTGFEPQPDDEPPTYDPNNPLNLPPA